MIAWIIGIITLILLLFMVWRWRSKEARERFEQPKFQFLRSLGIPSQDIQQAAKTDVSQEKKHAERNS
jgi:FtsZ-interacting cell division protein ZipA